MEKDSREIAIRYANGNHRIQNKLTQGSTSHSRGYNIIGEDKFLKNVPFRLLKGTIIVLFDAV